MTVLTGEDRTAGEEKSGKDNRGRTALAGRIGRDGKKRQDKTAGAGQPRQDHSVRTSKTARTR